MTRFNYLVYFLILSSTLYGYESRSEISLNQFFYSSHKSETVLSGFTELKLKKSDFEALMNLEYLYSNEYSRRRYISINELYLSKKFDDYRIDLGKQINYWGELEGYNISDIFNTKNYLNDIFDSSKKLGSWALSAVKYSNEDSFEVGIKFYENDLNYPFITDYSKHLSTEKSRWTPSLYFLYSFVTNSFLESENKIIFWYGYDNKRYFTPINQTTVSQFAYRVKKIIFLSNIVYEDYIYKVESAYSDVIDDPNIADYAQISFGVERGLFDLSGADLNLYGEYYRYIYFGNEKIEGVDISEIYNNDIFLAFRLNFNDVESSVIESGLLYDLQSGEKIFKIKAKSRIKERFILSSEFLSIYPAKDGFLSKLTDHRRVMVGITYTF